MRGRMWGNIVVLLIAAFLGECLEFLIQMMLARELGEEGLGMYMSLLPTIMFLVVIASFEIPVSLSKMIAETKESYHLSLLQHVIRFVTAFTLFYMVGAILLFPLIPVFNSYHEALPFLLFILIPIISFSSVARGYFMGVSKMTMIAGANFLRRAVQLVLLILLFQLLRVSGEIAILLSISTLIATEAVVLTFLSLFLWKDIKGMKKEMSETIENDTVFRRLFSVSLPTTGLRVFHAASFAVKPFLIKFALMQAGVEEEIAVSQYGELAGVAFAIGFFPAFIAHVLLIVFIPAVSRLYAQKNIPQLKRLFWNAMKGTMVYATPAAILFYSFADPLTALFFDESLASLYLQLLVPYFFFHFFVIPMQAFLIGLGLIKDAFYHAVWSTFFSYVCMFVLGSLPSLQMDGIIIGMNAGVVLLTWMHFLTIQHRLKEPVFFHWKEAIR